MINTERLVEKARKIKEGITTSLDPIMNRNSMLALGGVSGFVGLKIATLALTEAHVPQPHDLATLVTTLPFAYPILKGATGNLREYFSSGKTLSLAQTRRDMTHMVFAGVGMHFAGEYAQTAAYALGGPDFGQNFYFGHDLNQFFLDPHMIPYWSFNIPGFYLMGKGLVSEVKNSVGSAVEQIQMVRSLAKQKPPVEPK